MTENSYIEEEKCISQYIIDALRKGKYDLDNYHLGDSEVRLTIKRGWFTKDQVKILHRYGEKCFYYNNTQIESDLVEEALSIIDGQERAKRRQKWETNIKKISRELDC